MIIEAGVVLFFCAQILEVKWIVMDGEGGFILARTQRDGVVRRVFWVPSNSTSTVNSKAPLDVPALLDWAMQDIPPHQEGPRKVPV